MVQTRFVHVRWAGGGSEKKHEEASQLKLQSFLMGMDNVENFLPGIEKSGKGKEGVVEVVKGGREWSCSNDMLSSWLVGSAVIFLEF